LLFRGRGRGCGAIARPRTCAPLIPPPCRKARLTRVLNSAAGAAAGATRKLAPAAAAALARALEEAVFNGPQLQRKVDVYVDAAWAALGASYLQVRSGVMLGLQVR
jgi:hypothetical protein